LVAKKHLTGDILKTQDMLPVLLSIVVIILVALLEKQSKFAAAITATMPIGATLAIWIVYSANSGDQQTMKDFSVGLLMGIVPSIGFLIAALLSSKSRIETCTHAVGWVFGVGGVTGIDYPA